MVGGFGHEVDLGGFCVMLHVCMCVRCGRWMDVVDVVDRCVCNGIELKRKRISRN